MFIHKWDQGSEKEWRAFVASHGFGELVATGRNRDVAVVVPTQFALQDDTLYLHFLRQNPIWEPIEENPKVLFSISGDWAFIPSDWKAIGDEDPRMGIPTTYYAAVQLVGTAEVIAEPEGVAEVLRVQLAAIEPGVDVADPAEHGSQLRAIQAMKVEITEVRSKFKYGGNVDQSHRLAVIDRLEDRDSVEDRAAAEHVRRRLA